MADERTTVSRNPSTLYPVASGERIPRDLGRRSYVRARATGEQRPPRRGEWYLSGAIVEAYRARNDLTQTFHIATLVRGALGWPEAHTWADSFGVWHARVTRHAASPLIAARRALRDELEAREANLSPDVWRHPIRVPEIDDDATIVYRERKLLDDE